MAALVAVPAGLCGRVWGWEELMRQATGNGRLGPERDTRKGRRLELLCALRRAREELGRWPTAREWELATDSHVSRRSSAEQQLAERAIQRSEAEHTAEHTAEASAEPAGAER